MSRPIWLTVVEAELRQHLRDPLTIVAMVGVPLVAYPILGIAGNQIMESVKADEAAEVLDVVVTGDSTGLVLPPTLRRIDHPDPEVAVTTGAALAAVSVRADGADLWLTGNKQKSRNAAERLEDALDEAALAKAPRRLETNDTLSAAERARESASRVVPALLLFTMVTGGLYTALDLVTGEKERGTLETTLTTAASRRAIIAAKYLCVFLFSVVGVWLSVASGWASAHWVAGVEIPVSTAILGAVLMLPGCAFVSALLVAAAAWVPDFKAGQIYTMPLLLIPVALGGIAVMPGVELTPATALFPIANLALALREVVAGRFPALPLAITFATSTLLALGSIRWAAAQLGREDVILGSRTPGQRRLRGDYRLDAWWLFSLGLLGMWLVAVPLQAVNLVWGMVATQVGLLLTLALVAPAVVGLPVRETLRLVRPTARGVIEGLGLGLCTPLVGWAVLQVQGLVLPAPGNELVVALTEAGPLWVQLLVFALLPGVCEELMFRGAFFGLYRSKSTVWAALVVSSLAFGAFHVEVYRVLPTAAIGACLCALSIRHRSVIPGMLAHAVNNGIALIGS